MFNVQGWCGLLDMGSCSAPEGRVFRGGPALLEPETRGLEIVRRAVSKEVASLLVEVQRQEGDKRPEKESSHPENGEAALNVDILERIKELESTKKSVSDEMDQLVRAFSLSGAGSRAVGCLRLEEVHSVKNNRRYGPYGPYYYLYLHRTGKLEKRYLGKSAESFKVRRDAIVKLRQLEAEYKRILKLERQLTRRAQRK